MKEDATVSSRTPRRPSGSKRSGARAASPDWWWCPRAPLAGKSIRDFGLRKTYSVEPIVLLAGAERQPADFFDKPLSIGDVLVVAGGYRNADYIRAGRLMSLLFLALAVGAIWLLFVSPGPVSEAYG